MDAPDTLRRRSAVAPRGRLPPAQVGRLWKEVDSVERIYSSELAGHVGERVLLAGWVHARRELGSVSFLVLRDCAGLVQVVLGDGPLKFLPESVRPPA
jgi:hypothetical protein